MTILDALMQFDNAAQLTSTQPSTNIIDLGNPRDLGVGEPIMKIGVYTGIAGFATTNSGTLNVQFQGSTDSVTWTTYAESGVLALAVLGANQDIASFRLPQVEPNGGPRPRYLRLNYVVGTGIFSTTSLVTAMMMLDKPANYAYPSGFSVPVAIKTFP